MKVFHKKGSPAPAVYIRFLGWCRSYWAEDGYHDSETGEVIK